MPVQAGRKAPGIALEKVVDIPEIIKLVKIYMGQS